MEPSQTLALVQPHPKPMQLCYLDHILSNFSLSSESDKTNPGLHGAVVFVFAFCLLPSPSPKIRENEEGKMNERNKRPCFPQAGRLAPWIHLVGSDQTLGVAVNVSFLRYYPCVLLLSPLPPLQCLTPFLVVHTQS